MREIKFRAWDTLNKLMMVSENYMFIHEFFKDIEWREENNRTKIMQFTGLKDKNGKEIYEGDILKGKKKINFLVEYSDERGMFIASFFGGYFNFNDELGEEQEIIGNKFENPELLSNSSPPVRTSDKSDSANAEEFNTDLKEVQK